ncbi:MAG: DUF948 domain-containing protein [bacterium]
MTTFLELCLIVITAAVTVLVVYLVQTLMQLKKTTQSLDGLINKISKEVDNVEETLANVTNISRAIGKIGGPTVSIMALVMGLLKGFNFIKKKEKEG